MIRDFDEKFSRREGDNSTVAYYSKQYKSSISQSESPDYVSTQWHRVINIDGVETTHHPLCK